MKILKRRRLENKTDYKARLALLKSRKPRLVVRKTNKYVIVQIVQADVAQDKVLFGITSKELLNKGWPSEMKGSLKSLSASYLTGFLIGKMAKDKVKEAILDSGMYRNIHKTKIYAVLKGAIDAGIKVPCSNEALPSLEDIKKNEKTSQIIDKLISKI